MSLRPQQVASFEETLHIFRNVHFAAVQTGPTGSGKTYYAYAIASALGLPAWCCCPLSLIEKHREVAQLFKVRLIHDELPEKKRRNPITFQSLRGVAGKKLNHPWLERNGDDFRITQEFKDIIDEGVLIIFDEFQNCKNATAQMHAAHAIVRYMMEEAADDCPSRVLLMSATPADKEAHAISIVKLLGLVRDTQMVEKVPFKANLPRGFNELIDTATALERNMPIPHAKSIREIPSGDYHLSAVIDETFRIYRDVVRPRLATQLPAPQIPYNKNVQNGFYEMDPEDEAQLMEALNALMSALRWQPDRQDIIKMDGNFGAVQMALVAMQKAKKRLMCRLAKEVLEEDPNAKVVLFTNFKKNKKTDKTNTFVEDMALELEEYGPQILNGDVSVKNRQRIQNIFGEANDRCRVIIAHPKVGGVGIDLDDKHGNFKRHMFIMPDYKFIDLVQALGRCFRSDTKSDMAAHFVYSRLGSAEMHILDALIHKRAVCGQLVAEADPSMFPSNYPNFYEGPNLETLVE